MAAFPAGKSPAVRNPISEIRLTARYARLKADMKTDKSNFLRPTLAGEKAVMALRPSKYLPKAWLPLLRGSPQQSEIRYQKQD